MISIVSPVYRAEKILPELVRKIKQVCASNGYQYEIILVEDSSPDDSWKSIEHLTSEHSEIVGIKLSRNFGQHAAITAGIENAKGDYVIVMDCDLQDDPKYIPELLDKAKEGFDIVYTHKKSRKHKFFKNLTATVFNYVFNWLVSDQAYMSSDNNIGSYSLITRKVVNAYKSVGDYKRHYLMVLRFMGFSSGYVEIEHSQRFEGASSYNWIRLINHALDGIVSQSNKLLRMTVILGLLISMLSFIMGLFVVIQALFLKSAPGWASTIVVVLFMGGLTILSIGVSALYLGSIADQVKNRPLYIIDKKLN